ncbi:MAG: hypothetical protein E7020_01545 [Alphaproteobacteria bacterium]|nr:hypothetical protein [Alphaproteobacteria bacterium]
MFLWFFINFFFFYFWLNFGFCFFFCIFIFNLTFYLTSLFILITKFCFWWKICHFRYFNIFQIYNYRNLAWLGAIPPKHRHLYNK